MEVKHFKYIVLGAGVSGLTAALELQNSGQELAILEKDLSPGGVLQTIKDGEFLWDRAAHTIAVSQDLSAFLKKYGMSSFLQKTSEAAKLRQIAIDGDIWDISNHPAKILGAKFLSWNAKFMLLKELFKPPITLHNPTVYEFFDYHFGEEITRNIISAVFAGIYAGDIEKMEMKSVMPSVFEIEQEEGSLIRGLIKNKGKSAGREIYGLHGGMEVLCAELAKQVTSIYYDSNVTRIQKLDGKFVLKVGQNVFTCDHLISTLPAYRLHPLISDLSTSMQAMLAEVQYAAMLLIHLGFTDLAEHQESKAFGFLCGQFSSPVLKGAIYNSDLFNDRAPKGSTSFSIFMKPKQEWLSDEETLDIEISRTIKAFKKLTNITSEPSIVKRSVWRNAIPQFNKPYAQLKTRMLQESEQISGFTLSGSYISGVSVPDCIKYNIGIAEKLAKA